MLKKGISPFVAIVFIVLITIMAMAIVLFIALPAIERAKEAAVINEAMLNMKAIANNIKTVASEGVGSLRSTTIKATAGEYKVNEKSNSMDFTYTTKTGIVQPGSFIKEGDITLSAGANAKASEYDLDGDGANELVLENEILRIVILKNGTSASYSYINTSKLIKIMNFKETGANITPSESTILLDDYTGSSYGYGYSELVRTGDRLAKAEALVHVNSTFIIYDVLYSLHSGADFLMVKIQNAYYR